MDNTRVKFKYNEDTYLAELSEYVAATYGSHYVGEDNIQALDLIFATHHGEGFCIGNILKYASRYGKKKGHNRDDLMKVLHYAILMLRVHDTEHVDKLSVNTTFTPITDDRILLCEDTANTGNLPTPPYYDNYDPNQRYSKILFSPSAPVTTNTTTNNLQKVADEIRPIVDTMPIRKGGSTPLPEIKNTFS